MDAKQIENQIAANQIEAVRIQSQLLQMDANNPQRQTLNSRLEMLNRAQTYWANEYFKLTGQNLNIPPIKITLSASLPVTPPPLPSAFSADKNAEMANKLAEWKKMRQKITASLSGNPKASRVESYLDSVERNAGTKVPQITDMIVFGNAIQGSHGGTTEDFNGTPMSNKTFSFEDSDAIVLGPDGSVVTPSKGTLMVVYTPRNHFENNSSPKIEVHGTDMGEAFKTLRGE